MKELSVFIDESGDFGNYDPKAPFYIISMVVHDQSKDISSEVCALDEALKNTVLKRNFVHVGPLYKTFHIEKKHIGDDYEMISRLARQLSDFIKQHYPYFLSFDTIKLYYDNGQAGVMKIIISVFTTLFDNTDYKKSLLVVLVFLVVFLATRGSGIDTSWMRDCEWRYRRKACMMTGAMESIS